jgi:hypothetical protein
MPPTVTETEPRLTGTSSPLGACFGAPRFVAHTTPPATAIAATSANRLSFPRMTPRKVFGGVCENSEMHYEVLGIRY